MNLKLSLLRAARGLGLFALVLNSRWRRSCLLILCYHGVSLRDEHEWNPELYITSERLRRRLELLRWYRCSVVPLDKALGQLAEGSLPPRSVSITFDDGMRDFAERAVPILRAFGTPATVYLTTYYCDRQLPVFDTALSYILWKGRSAAVDLRGVIGASHPLRVETPRERRATWRALYEAARLRQMTAFGKHALLGAVAERLGVDFGEFVASGLLQVMAASQVRSLPGELVDVQLHTHRHRTPRERAAFAREISDNRSRIASITGNGGRLRHFCYPSGDYSLMFLDWLREHGVQSATTCVPGLVTPTTNPLLLPRVLDTMQTMDIAFEAWISGFAAMLPRRRVHVLDPVRP